jgi:hypothetical protein
MVVNKKVVDFLACKKRKIELLANNFKKLFYYILQQRRNKINQSRCWIWEEHRNTKFQYGNLTIN